MYAVLDRAVEAGVVSQAEAELIAATGLDRQTARSYALQSGMSVRALFRRRAAAEQRLATALLGGEV